MYGLYCYIYMCAHIHTRVYKISPANYKNKYSLNRSLINILDITQMFSFSMNIFI